MLLPPDKKEDEAAAEAALAASSAESRRRRHGHRHRHHHHARYPRYPDDPSEQGGSGTRRAVRNRERGGNEEDDATLYDSGDEDLLTSDSLSEHDEGGSDDFENPSPSRRSGDRSRAQRLDHHHYHHHARRGPRRYRTDPSGMAGGGFRHVIQERDIEAVPPPSSSAPHSHRRRFNYLRSQWNAYRSSSQSDTSSSAANERDPLLLPPPYSEAEVPFKRRKRKVWWLTALGSAFGIFVIILITIVAVEYKEAKWREKAGWIRGGADGKGDQINKLSIHARGSSFVGSLYVTPLDSPLSWLAEESDRNITFNSEDIHVRVEAAFVEENTLKAWHTCRFSDNAGKAQGIVIVGPEDGRQPVQTPWLESFLRFEVAIAVPAGFPRERLAEILDLEDVDESGYSTGIKAGRQDANKVSRASPRLPDLEIDVIHTPIRFLGPLGRRGPCFNSVRVVTSGSKIEVEDLSAATIHLEGAECRFDIDHAAATERELVLVGNSDPIHCNNCTSAKDILIHALNSAISGQYQARLGIDVFAGGQPVDGSFDAGKIWVRNRESDVRGNFTGIRYMNGYGGALIQNSAGDINLRMSIAEDSESEPSRYEPIIRQFGKFQRLDREAIRSSMTPRVSEDPFIPVRLMSSSGSLTYRLDSVPSNVITDINLASGAGELLTEIAAENWYGDVSAQTTKGRRIMIGIHDSDEGVPEPKRFTAHRPSEGDDDEHGKLPWWQNAVKGEVIALDESNKTGKSRLSCETTASDIRMIF